MKKNIQIKEQYSNNISSVNYKFRIIINFILSFFSAIFLAYFLYFPKNSGGIGLYIFENLNNIFGDSARIFPFFILLFSINLLFKNKNFKGKFFSFLNFILILLLCSFTSGIYEIIFSDEKGGIIGVFLYDILKSFLGEFGSILLIILFLILIILILYYDIFSYLFFKHKNENTQKNENSNNSEKKPLKFLNIFNIVKKSHKKEHKKLNLLKEFENFEKENFENTDKNNETKNLDYQDLKNNETKENKPNQYFLPSVELLDKPKFLNLKNFEKELNNTGNILVKALESFGVNTKIVGIVKGPCITMYELELAEGIKVSTIISLKNDICLATKSPNVRIIAPIPGKSAIGIEIPNPIKEPVLFREFVENSEFKNSKMILPFALGKTVDGKIFITDIAKTPHLLIAGATGSGKSVCVNSLIMSILYSKTPDEVKFILVDPKVVELSYYKDIPHLYHPVITNPKEASKVLSQVVLEMEDRYLKFADEGVRNIESYNEKMRNEKKEEEFYLIVVIDELADLMLVASKDVEESIVRLTQKARAVGIHVVLATQRPSVNVITGIIKANLPSRIAFQVISKIDSRVILDTNGAEDLLGKGDMLFLENGASKPIRLQGAFLSEKEVSKVINFIKNQMSPDFTKFNQKIKSIEEEQIDEKMSIDLKKALNFVLERKKVSYDLLRANGFSGPKATNVISLMEIQGFINKPQGTQKWEIDLEKIEEYLKKNN